MLNKLNKVKRQFILAIFLSLAFIFPSTGIVSSVDALGNYECWTKNRRQHVSCLRAKLDSTPYGLTVPKARDGMGIYRCFNKKRRKHVNCLRGLLDQHGPHLAKGATGVVPPAATTTASPPPGRQEILAAEEAARAEQEKLAAPTPEQTAPPTATPTAPTAAERAQAGSEAPCAPRTYITRQRIVTAEEYIPELERKITCLKEAFRAPGYGNCMQTIVDCRASTSNHGDIPIEPLTHEEYIERRDVTGCRLLVPGRYPSEDLSGTLYNTRQRGVTAEEYIPELERKITCLKEAFRAPGYGDCMQTIVDCRANTSDHGDIPIEPPPCLSFPSSSPNAC